MKLLKVGILGLFIGLVATLLLAGCTTTEPTAMVYPKPTNYVVDEAGVISEGLEISLNKNLDDFRETAQIAVVTVKTTQPLDEKQYAINLAREWGIGSAEKDNGVLFLIVTEDRKLRIETGRGTEGVLTDAEAGRILDDHVVPSLKAGNWEEGIKNGVSAIMEATR